MLKAESDVSDCLNDSLHNLGNVFIFVGEQIIAANGLLEASKSNGIGNESLARSQIEGKTVNGEARQIMKAQMSNGTDEIVNIVQLVRE